MCTEVNSTYDFRSLLFYGITAVSRLTETDRNEPERTETDLRKYRNGLLWVPKRTGTDFSEYRNGPDRLQLIPKRTSMGTKKGRVGYDRNDSNKVTYVLVGRYVCNGP